MTFTHFVTRKSSGILSDISSGILFGISSGICSGISSGILSGKFSGILSGISSGILSGKSSGILSGILCGKSSGIYSDISSGILSGILSDISSGIYSDISYMRSGREHVAWILAVEVRQGTLGVDGRGWGPAGNTASIQATCSLPDLTTTIHAQCSLPDLNNDHPRPVFPAGPQPRPSTHSVLCRTSTTTIHAQCSLPDLNWAWMVVVEVRQRTLWIASRSWAGGRGGQREEEDNERRRRGEEEEDQATDIKSNNPHLAGGEKQLGRHRWSVMSTASQATSLRLPQLAVTAAAIPLWQLPLRRQKRRQLPHVVVARLPAARLCNGKPYHIGF